MNKEIPPMPPVAARRSLEDDKPNGYLESDRDFFENNREACVWFLENAEAIRLLIKPVPKECQSIGRWGRFPTYQAKIGTVSSSCVVVKRDRKFFVGQRIQFAETMSLQGMSTGCTPNWRSGIIWKFEDDRLFIDLH